MLSKAHQNLPDILVAMNDFRVALHDVLGDTTTLKYMTVVASELRSQALEMYSETVATAATLMIDELTKTHQPVLEQNLEDMIEKATDFDEPLRKKVITVTKSTVVAKFKKCFKDFFAVHEVPAALAKMSRDAQAQSSSMAEGMEMFRQSSAWAEIKKTYALLTVAQSSMRPKREQEQRAVLLKQARESACVAELLKAGKDGLPPKFLSLVNGNLVLD